MPQRVVLPLIVWIRSYDKVTQLISVLLNIHSCLQKYKIIF